MSISLDPKVPVIVNIGGVVVVDHHEGDVFLFGNHVVESVAAIETEVEAPVVAQGQAEAEVEDGADIESQVVDFGVGGVVVGAEAVLGDIAHHVVAQGGEDAGGPVGAVGTAIVAVQRQVELDADATDEGPFLVEHGAVEDFHGDAEDAHGLAFFPVVEAGMEVVGHAGVGGMGEAGSDHSAVIVCIGVGVGVVDTEAEADMFAKEVGVVQTCVEAQPEALGAVGGAEGHGVQASAQGQACIIAVPVLLGIDREGQ